MVVLVSRIATAMVALNRLKKHFSQIHRHLNSGQFMFETLYRESMETSMDPATSSLPTTSPPPPPLLATAPTVVYQCPATIKQRGAVHQCKERMLDANALRIHWGSQHQVDGHQFSPLRLSMEDLPHYTCSVQGCGERTLTVGPLRAHWEKEHATSGAKFEVIHTSIAPNKPAVAPSKPAVTPSKPAVTPSKPAVTPNQPAVTPSKPAVDPKKAAIVPTEAKKATKAPAVKPKAREPEVKAKETEKAEKDVEAAAEAAAAEDASPMVPVGRARAAADRAGVE